MNYLLQATIIIIIITTTIFYYNIKSIKEKKLGFEDNLLIIELLITWILITLNKF